MQKRSVLETDRLLSAISRSLLLMLRLCTLSCTFSCRIIKDRLCACSGFIISVLLALVISSGSIYAADCDSILRQGVFNQTTVNHSLSVQDDLLQWLKTATDEQWTTAKNNGLTFSATIQGVPFNLNGTTSSNEFHRLQTSIDQGLITSLTQNELLQTVQLSASQAIVQAWLSCVQSTAAGLSCSDTLNGNSIIVFSAKWAPNSTADYPPTVTPGGFQVSSGATYSGPGLPSGSEILISGSSVILNRPGKLV